MVRNPGYNLLRGRTTMVNMATSHLLTVDAHFHGSFICPCLGDLHITFGANVHQGARYNSKELCSTASKQLPWFYNSTIGGKWRLRSLLFALSTPFSECQVSFSMQHRLPEPATLFREALCFGAQNP